MTALTATGMATITTAGMATITTAGMATITTTSAAPAQQPVAHMDPGIGLAQARVRQLLGEAVGELLSLFEHGRAEADALFERSGRSERIALRRDGNERRYSIGDASDARFLALFLSVPASDGHIFGGAYVNSSATTPSIYLRPSIADGVARWTLPLSGTAFTAATVRDLFLSVFESDAAATGRVAPLVGCDLWLTPWS